MEGPKMVEELLNSKYAVRRLFATKEWISEHSVNGPFPEEVNEAELTRISCLQTPNQVLALVEQKDPPDEPVLEGKLTLVLDGIQDPGNFGTIIRIADWFGIDQIVAGDNTVELYNPKTIQATMGSFMRVNCWYRHLSDFLQSVKIPVYGALLEGKSMYEPINFTEGLLLIGNEGRGIDAHLLKYISDPITIPRMGKAESLNAAVATGILVAHLKK
ncbi:MAG: hypothetical protein RLZZ28_908 [Bacteroidota bacterium]